MNPRTPMTNQELAHRMDTIEGKIDAFIAEMRGAMLHQARAIEKVQDNVAETRELVEAWGAVKTVGRFVKWSGGLLAGIVASWVLIKAALVALIK